ncbi:glycosyltransferase family 4 protein [bacterium]|nr:glycosyltransferase family 4 protein [bacterium]
MDILLITDCYPPEIRSISDLTQELAEEFTDRGHNITVVTSWPRYNLTIKAKQTDFDTFSIENNINVIRVKTPPHHKVNFIIRGISQLMLPYLFFKKLKKFNRQKIDAVIVYSPPLPLVMLGIKIKKIHNAKFLLNVQDIFPQNAIDLGIMKNKLIIKFFEWMENKAYEGAVKITSHTKHSREFLIEKKHIPSTKITVVPNWIDISNFKDIKARGIFREKYGLKDKFIFLFGGIIGPSQNLDFIIHVAKKIVDIPDLCFLLVGDGTEKKRLQKLVEEYDLQNVIFQPFISKEEYPFLVKEVDVGLACLNMKNRTPVIPGKILGFMASSIPVVAFLNKENDAHELIKEAQSGYSSLSDDPEKGTKLIRKIFNEKDKLAQYGQNGYNYTKTHFSKEICIDKIEQLIQ